MGDKEASRKKRANNKKYINSRQIAYREETSRFKSIAIENKQYANRIVKETA